MTFQSDTPRPDAVIFDIGNVLIGWQPERFYDAHVGPEVRRKLFETVDLHAMNEAIDRGADFRETVEATARAHPDYAPLIRLWHDRWLDLTGPIISPSLALLRQLRAEGIPVFALTNFGIGSFEIAERHYDFLAEFDRRFVSGHLGVTKPDPRIYAIVEEESGIPAERLFFIDDRADNIAAAAARGWQAFHFTDPEESPADLARQLADFGLIDEGTAREICTSSSPTEGTRPGIGG